MEQERQITGAIAPQHVGAARLGIGLLQGLAAWQLLALVPMLVLDGPSNPPPAWAQRHPVWFAVLAMWVALVPLIALAQLPRMRWRQLVQFLLATVAELAALVVYDFWREPVDLNHWAEPTVRIWPSAGLMLAAGFGLFIVNQLMEHRERGHRLYTHYAAHFEDSWIRGFQLVISLIFTLLVWGVLYLGQALFELIHIIWFGQMIEHNWFRCPVLAMAFAASVHLTDVRPALLRGMRNVGLTLLAWLLPLVVVLGYAFLIALLFTGLHPLWDTRNAATILLSSTAVSLFYLNAAYNDGDPANLPPRVLRWAGAAAGPMMLVLSMLAAYAIALRVGQHGWTPQRVRSAAVALVALIYGGGYGWASVSQGPWLKRLELANVTASLVILALLVALFSPLADPARLAVNSQVARLKAGTIAPDKFDYQFLRFDAGRYGTDALALLTRDGNTLIASRARFMQAQRKNMFEPLGVTDPAVTEPPLSHVTIYPAGAKLPPDFVADNISDMARGLFSCLRDGSACDIVVLGDVAQTSPLLLLRQHPRGETPRKGVVSNDPADVSEIGNTKSLPVLGRGPDGKWSAVGSIDNLDCPGVFDGLRKGLGAPVRPLHDDVLVNGVRLTFSRTFFSIQSTCPTPSQAPPKHVVGDAQAPARMGPAFGNPGGL